MPVHIVRKVPALLQPPSPTTPFAQKASSVARNCIPREGDGAGALSLFHMRRRNNKTKGFNEVEVENKIKCIGGGTLVPRRRCTARSETCSMGYIIRLFNGPYSEICIFMPAAAERRCDIISLQIRIGLASKTCPLAGSCPSVVA